MKVNQGTDLSSLTPSFVLSSGATGNLAVDVTRDFSQSQENPVVYSIAAEDGVTKQSRKVIVAVREDVVSTVNDNWIDPQLFPKPTNRYFEVADPGQMLAYISNLNRKQLTSIKSGNQIKFDLGS